VECQLASTYPELTMSRWFYSAALVVIFAALVGEVFVWYYDRSSSSYDECVVSEMRGQSGQMMYAVQKVCAIRFHKEDELPISYVTSGKLDFRMLPDFDKDPGVIMMGSKNFDKPPMIITVSKNETDYEITRAHMKHSFEFEADCSNISDDKWEDGPEFTFTNGVANVDMPGLLDEKAKLHRPPFCYQYMKIWGTPRKQ
jgi:hypothetical protein